MVGSKELHIGTKEKKGKSFHEENFENRLRISALLPLLKLYTREQ